MTSKLDRRYSALVEVCRLGLFLIFFIVLGLYERGG